jgi:hypothetical protein
MMAITPPQRAALSAYDNARAIIADIQKYSERVNTSAAGLSGMAGQAKKLWGAWTQSDPDATLLMSKAGELSQLARAMGEKGALANEDVARVAALTPSVMDTREIAVRKLKDMVDIVNRGEMSFRKSLGVGAMAPVQAAPSGKKPLGPLGTEVTGKTTEGRPVVKNPDGSVSTERTITVTDSRLNGGRATNIPSMFGGKEVSEDEAIERIVKAGGKDPETGRSLPGYASIEEAVTAAEERSSGLGQELEDPRVSKLGHGGMLGYRAAKDKPDFLERYFKALEGKQHAAK